MDNWTSAGGDEQRRVEPSPRAVRHEAVGVGHAEQAQRIERGALAVCETLGVACGNLLRREATVLPAVDALGQRARRPALVVDVFRLQHLLDQTNLIVGVENREARLQPHEFGVAAQDLGADRVEGAEPLHGLRALADELVRRGHEVFVTARNPPAGRSDVLALDLSRPGSVREVFLERDRRVRGRLDVVVNKSADVTRVYLPPDVNSLLSVVDHCLRSENYINVIVSDKQKHVQYMDMNAAPPQC